METGEEGELQSYPSPDELWALTFAEANAWRDRFAAVPFEDRGGSHPSRYYQDIAVERVMEAIAADKQRILLTEPPRVQWRLGSLSTLSSSCSCCWR
jgi:type I restriction enzyme, R subunit